LSTAHAMSLPSTIPLVPAAGNNGASTKKKQGL
jgi:hypothetical protein